MSNTIPGFAEFAPQLDVPHQELVSQLENSSGLGVSLLDPSELYHFPDSHLPSASALVFLVSDCPGIKNATNLIDGLDYAPEADIGMPLRSRDRIELILLLIESLFTDHHVSRLCIAFSDMDQIEAVIKTRQADLRKTILEDCESNIMPPCSIYDITAD
ncbi:hypothetical protein [Gimesia sp.]|uniref:hypothetical protein n=1 Tax=Gimesia sp. TaxID=2024833 RepID=UPI000C52B3A8|nr:hypothetical protein [Gimesia sp.]MAX38605.1 hypothetical protein [Gimesia sp.]HBL47833.1 hypothetical protein [Planctomycetaceae bacterium]|tara:strand:+ start:164 stop:640 length:477 start_codon:yes stop_codon:yes gene_type:complete